MLAWQCSQLYVYLRSLQYLRTTCTVLPPTQIFGTVGYTVPVPVPVCSNVPVQVLCTFCSTQRTRLQKIHLSTTGSLGVFPVASSTNPNQKWQNLKRRNTMTSSLPLCTIIGWHFSMKVDPSQRATTKLIYHHENAQPLHLGKAVCHGRYCGSHCRLLAQPMSSSI